MKRFFRTFVCVLLMFAVCPGVVISQELNDVYNEFQLGYREELFSSPEQSQKHMEYWNAFTQHHLASNQKVSELTQKFWNDLVLKNS